MQRGVFFERTDEIDHSQTGKKLPAFILRDDRTARSFHPRHRSIRINGDDQGIAQAAGPAKQIDMTGVQNVKASVRENNSFSCTLKPPDFTGNRWNR